MNAGDVSAHAASGRSMRPFHMCRTWPEKEHLLFFLMLWTRAPPFLPLLEPSLIILGQQTIQRQSG